MCEVTNDNFESKFQEISYNLQKANYIGMYFQSKWKHFINKMEIYTLSIILAIDTEFTGLHLENFKPR